MGMRLAIVMGLALVGGGLAGCFGPGYEARIEARHAEKLAAWEAANPDEPVTEARTKELLDQAVSEVKAELVAEYGEEGVGAVTSIASGNWVAAAFHALGLAGIFFGLKKPKAVTV